MSLAGVLKLKNNTDYNFFFGKSDQYKHNEISSIIVTKMIYKTLSHPLTNLLFSWA